MISFLKGEIELDVTRVYSIDVASKTLKGTEVSMRSVRDMDFAGHGEKETYIPQIQNVTLENIHPTELGDTATQAIVGIGHKTLGVVKFTRISNSSIVGVA